MTLSPGARRNRALRAQPFNADQLSLTGGVTQIADNVLKEGPGSSAFSASNNGVLVFWGGAVPPDTQLTWLDRDGAVAGKVGEPAGYLCLALSPDQRTVAVSRFEPNEKGLPIALWLLDIERNSSTKLTFGMGSQNPVWSSDGARVTFSSARSGPPSLFQKFWRDDTPDEQVLKTLTSSAPTDWSPDGHTLAYQMLDPTTQLDLWLLPNAAPRTPIPFLRGPANETDGRISPDGQWIAYVSDESGRQEVYLTSFPKAGSKRSISTGGGRAPQWRRDGRELFYASANGELMAVPMSSTATPATVVLNWARRFESEAHVPLTSG